MGLSLIECILCVTEVNKLMILSCNKQALTL